MTANRLLTALMLLVVVLRKAAPVGPASPPPLFPVRETKG